MGQGKVGVLQGGAAKGRFKYQELDNFLEGKRKKQINYHARI